MGTGGRRDPQHIPPDHTYENVASSAASSMGPPTADHYSQSQFTSSAQAAAPIEPHSRSHGSDVASYAFHGQHPGAHHLQSNFPLQTTSAGYSSFLQDQLRSNQMQPPPPHTQYPQYQMDYMLSSAQHDTSYDPTSQFHERRPVSQGIMTPHFPVGPYIPSNEHGAVSVGESSSGFMNVPSNQTAYGTETINQAQQSTSYPVPSSTYQSLEQHDARQPQRLDQDSAKNKQSMQEYERELRRVFDAIVAGRVTEAADKLVQISRWLLSSIEQLKLHHDDERQYEQRIHMWREFNHAWEALGQKQKALAQEMVDTGQRAADTLKTSDIVRIMNELVTLCDKIEPFALVDYELGVWEEQIVSVFIQCLDLLSQYESSVQVDLDSQPQ